MEKTNTLRVLLADAHPVMRVGLKSIINPEPDLCVVAEAAEGMSMTALYAEYRPQVVLMDLCPNYVEGLATVRALRAASPAARIIILTAYGGEEDIYRALEAGVRGYLLKSAEPAEVLAALRAVGSGQKYIAAAAAMQLAQCTIGSELTGREAEVLREIALGKSNQEVAQALHISEGTVKYHVVNLLEKLGVGDRTQAVVAAVTRGVIHLP